MCYPDHSSDVNTGGRCSSVPISPRVAGTGGGRDARQTWSEEAGRDERQTWSETAGTDARWNWLEEAGIDAVQTWSEEAKIAGGQTWSEDAGETRGRLIRGGRKRHGADVIRGGRKRHGADSLKRGRRRCAVNLVRAVFVSLEWHLSEISWFQEAIRRNFTRSVVGWLPNGNRYFTMRFTPRFSHTKLLLTKILEAVMMSDLQLGNAKWKILYWYSFWQYACLFRRAHNSPTATIFSLNRNRRSWCSAVVYQLAILNNNFRPNN